MWKAKGKKDLGGRQMRACSPMLLLQERKGSELMER